MQNYEMKEFFILLFAACLCRIISTENDVRLPPYLVRSPRKKTVVYREWQILKLECGAKGTPAAVRYEWKKNGFQCDLCCPEYPPLPNGKIYVPDGTIEVIFGARSDFEGYYQCFAQNQYGTAISNMIHFRMAFINSYTGPLNFLRKTVVEGMPFYIRADREECFPKPTYHWSITGAEKSPLLLSKRIQIAENGDLHFAYALPEDARNGAAYECSKFYQFLDRTTANRNTTVVVTRNPEGNISQSAPSLAFSSETETVALVGESATLRCFFYG